jgi:hypothetical protein
MWLTWTFEQHHIDVSAERLMEIDSLVALLLFECRKEGLAYPTPKVAFHLNVIR